MNRLTWLRLLSVLGLAALPPALRAAAAPATGTGHFSYAQAGRSLTVWYDVPAQANPQTPVVFVMPGIKRNGEDYLNDWKALAEAQPFVLVVPEFPLTQFPGDAGYILGNTVDKSGQAVPREQWAFSMIEPIFDAIKARTGNQSAAYRLYGHSAGAQFVQRFVYFVPRARLSQAVTANAGWYMMPDRSVAFPYGLKDTPVTDADLRHALALPLTVLLGTADTDAKDKVLRHTPEADAQGAYRFVRGQYFFSHSVAAAQALGTPLGWHLATAPGVGHSDEKMAPFAVKVLFPDSP